PSERHRWAFLTALVVSGWNEDRVPARGQRPRAQRALLDGGGWICCDEPRRGPGHRLETRLAARHRVAVTDAFAGAHSLAVSQEVRCLPGYGRLRWGRANRYSHRCKVRMLPCR